MTPERRAEDPAPLPHRDDGPLGTAAIISYLLISMFFWVAAGVFAIVFFKIEVEPVLLTTLGSIITAATAALAAVGGFWLASSSGAKANSAAIRQLAGAGAPPPNEPGAIVQERSK